MLNYIIRRIILLIPIMLGVSLIAFSIMHLTPEDPIIKMLGEGASEELVSELRAELGLDDPIHIQYLAFLERFFVKGDMGRSILNGRPVMSLIAGKLPNTIILAFTAMFIAIIVSIPIGVISATKPNSLIDNLSRIGALIGLSLPGFWLALVLMYLFSVHFKLLPPSGFYGPEYLILPALALSMRELAVLTRITRSSMLEVIKQDYVVMARSKGLTERSVIYKHALRNALIPIVTVAGLQFGRMLGGAFIIETVFAFPGIGWLTVDAIRGFDYPVVQASIMVMTTAFVLANLLVDIIYAYLDPKIRYDRD